MTKKRERREAETALLTEPETLSQICDFIADRGTLRGWCRSMNHAVRYTRVYQWLHDDPDRLKAYAKALDARNDALGDTVIDGMRESTEADVRLLYDQEGKTIPPHQLPDALARVVNKVKVTRKTLTAGKGEDAVDIGEEVTTEYGIDSRVASREQLGKHLGLFEKDNRLSLDGKLGVEDANPEETARRIAFALAAALQGKPKPKAATK